MVKPEINVTPLIDVLLVLLIIFMVVSPVRPERFEAKVPAEPKLEVAGHSPLLLVVIVDKNGDLFINREKVAGGPAAVTERLKEVFAARHANDEPERTVFIRAPRSMDYGSVARTVDAVKSGGAVPIALQIDGLD